MPTQAFADTLNKVTTMPVKMPAFSSMIVHTILGLIVIIAIIYVALYVIKKLSPVARLSNSNNAKIISILPLNTKQQVYVIKMYSKIYLLGSTAQSINKIDTIENPEEIEKILNSTPKQVGFDSILGKFTKKKDKIN